MGSKILLMPSSEEVVNKVMSPPIPDDQPDFSGTQWDLIHAQGASEDGDDQKSVKGEMLSGGEIAAILIDEFSNDLKKRVKKNEVVAQGAQTLLCRYKASLLMPKYPLLSIDLVGYLESQYKALKGATFVEDVTSLLMHKQLVDGEEDQKERLGLLLVDLQ